MNKSVNKNKETITNELGLNSKKASKMSNQVSNSTNKKINQSLTEDQKLVLEMKEKMQTSHVFDKHSKKDVVEVKSNVRNC